MSEPRVVLALPTYDSERHLPATLRCVQAQDYGNLAILIRDDGSRDGTRALCAAFAAEIPCVTVLEGTTRLGWIGNYSALLEHARGEYFCWVPHDDLFEPSYVRAMVAHLQADSGAVLAYSAATRIDAHDRPLGAWPGTGRVGGEARAIERGLRYLWWNEGEKGWPFHGVMRLDALRTTRGLRTTRFAADSLLLFHMALLGRFTYDPRTLCRKRMYEGSVSTTYGHSWGEWDEYLRAHHAVIRAARLPATHAALLHAATDARRVRCLATRPFGALRRALYGAPQHP